MANPSGGTFHYTRERLNEPGYPGIVRDDGTFAPPAPHRGTGLAGSVGEMLRRYPIPAFLGAVLVGCLAGCLLSRS
jgi:hypothetical protein